MPILKRSFSSICTTALVAGSMLAAPIAEACTRFVYHGTNNQVMTARSMDWKVDVATNLWIFPRGMKRSGEAGKNSIQWTSKYGSVIASGYDISTTDGLNEAGLSVGALWLVESEYPKYDGTTPGLSIAAWAQYVLDNFATVDEAVKSWVPILSQLSRTRSPAKTGWQHYIWRYPIPAATVRSSNISTASR